MESGRCIAQRLLFVYWFWCGWGRFGRNTPIQPANAPVFTQHNNAKIVQYAYAYPVHTTGSTTCIHFQLLLADKSSIIFRMASLWKKLRTLFLANLHDVADKAIQTNSLAVYDEYIRQAEREIKDFKETIAPMFAQVKTSRRRREALATRAAKLDIQVDNYLQRGKKTEALVTQRKFVSTMTLIKSYDRTLEKQVSAAETLHDVLLKLEGRLDIAKHEREELGFLLQLAKAKETSAKAMKSLDSLIGQGDGELAQAAESIRKRLDHADATWEVQTDSLDSQLDEAVNDIEIEADLAERMERLGIN